MNAPLIFAPPGEVRVAAGLAEAVASWDECVLVLGESGLGAVLDRAARDLSARRARCVRVRAPASGGLSLRGLMAQVVGRADASDLTDVDLEAGFAMLTEPGEDYDRVVLMVEGAHALLPSAVRYIRLACRSGPQLRVVLAGRPGLEAVLAGEEFADLRRRFTRRLALPDPGGDGPEAAGGADGPAPRGRSGLFSAAPESPLDAPDAPAALVRLRDAAWTVTKLGLAVSLVVWMVRLGSPVPPPAPQRAASPDPAGASDEPFHAAPAAAEPPRVEPPRAGPPRSDPSRAGSGAPLAVWTTRWEDVPAPPAPPPSASDHRVDPVGSDPSPAGRESPATVPPAPPVAAAPFGSPAAVESTAPPDRSWPGDAARSAPPAVADAPGSTASAAATRDRAEEGPPPATVEAPPPAEAAPVEAVAPPTRRDTTADRDAVSAPSPEPPSEQTRPLTSRQAAPAAGPDAPETPAQGQAASRVPDPVSAPPPSALPPPMPPPPMPPPPDPAVALPLPPIPPQQPPRSPGTSTPPPESPAARRARGPVERAGTTPAAPLPVAPVPTARLDERRCRDLVLKAQLGDLSDAETRFLRGGCHAE